MPTPPSDQDLQTRVQQTAGDNPDGQQHATALQNVNQGSKLKAAAQAVAQVLKTPAAFLFHNERDVQNAADLRDVLAGEKGTEKEQKAAQDKLENASRRLNAAVNSKGGTSDWLTTFDAAFELLLALQDYMDAAGVPKTPFARAQYMANNLKENVKDAIPTALKVAGEWAANKAKNGAAKAIDWMKERGVPKDEAADKIAKGEKAAEDTATQIQSAADELGNEPSSLDDSEERLDLGGSGLEQEAQDSGPRGGPS